MKISNAGSWVTVETISCTNNCGSIETKFSEYVVNHHHKTYASDSVWRFLFTCTGNCGPNNAVTVCNPQVCLRDHSTYMHQRPPMSPPNPPPQPPPLPPLCGAGAAAAGCDVRVAVDDCIFFRGAGGQLQLGRKCLAIDRPFTLALIAATCYENQGQTHVVSTECLELEADGYGRYAAGPLRPHHSIPTPSCAMRPISSQDATLSRME